MHYLQIIFYTLIILLIVVYMYIKLKYPFWSSQPVFHMYDFYYWFFSPGYINKDLPEKNKFTNFYSNFCITEGKNQYKLLISNQIFYKMIYC